MHPNARIPTKSHDSDAGWDLYIAEIKDNEDGYFNYDFGIAFDIPKGHVGLIFPRSSVYKTGTSLSNCVGVIDSGYTGSVSANFHANADVYQPSGSMSLRPYLVGDRSAQIVFLPLADVQTLTLVDEFDTTSERGDGGFGSTGR